MISLRLPLLTTTKTTNTCLIFLLTTYYYLLSCFLYETSDALQFFLHAHTKRCFREDIPMGMNTVFSYTIAQGSGAMPVNVYVTDGLDKTLQYRQSADHGVMTFKTPTSYPPPPQSDDNNDNSLKHEQHNAWSLQKEEDGANSNNYHHNHNNIENDAQELYRRFPDAVGDSRLPHMFCFEHPRSLHLPHLGGTIPKRRIIFNVAYGVHAKTQQFYDQLAKEKHLSSTEELFRVVEDRVTDIVRLIDEMRQRETRMGVITETTTKTVTLYSTLACLAIVIGAIFTNSSTIGLLGKEKKRLR